MQSAAQSALERINELKSGARKHTGFMTHFTDLDRIISGFQPGTLNIIAARPSMGKTALALNIAQFGGNAETNSHVLFFSLEMSTEQLTHRMFSAQTLEFGEGVRLSAITSGELNEYASYAVSRAAESLQSRNIYLHYSSELSAMDFRTKSRRFKTRPDLGLEVEQFPASVSRTPKTRRIGHNEIFARICAKRMGRSGEISS